MNETTNGHLPSAPVTPSTTRPLNQYSKMIGDMKGTAKTGLCCSGEVHPYDPDQRPIKERTPFRHYLPEYEHELTNKVSDKHFGNRSGLHIKRRIGTWGSLQNMPSMWAQRLAIWHAAIEGDDSLIKTAVSVCLAQNSEGRQLLHVVTHPENITWLSETLRLWAETSPHLQEAT